MPKPYDLQLGGSLSWGTLALRHRPNHAYMVGIIAAEWAFLEEELTYGFAYWMGTQQLTASGQVAPSGNSLAAIALDQIYGTPPKIRLVKAAMADKLTPELLDQLLEVLDGIKSAGEKRNAVVHGTWGLDPVHPDCVILRSRKGLLLYTVQDLEEVAVMVANAATAIQRFTSAWLNAKREELQGKPAT